MGYKTGHMGPKVRLCGHLSTVECRGVCEDCCNKYRTEVRRGHTTWKKLEFEYKTLPPRRER